MEILLSTTSFIWACIFGMTWSQSHAKSFAQTACYYCAGYEDTRNCNVINTYTRSMRCFDHGEICYTECVSEGIVQRGCTLDWSNTDYRKTCASNLCNGEEVICSSAPPKYLKNFFIYISSFTILFIYIIIS